MIRIAADDYEFEGPTIIYCPTKKSTEDVLNVVKSKSVTPCMFGSALVQNYYDPKGVYLSADCNPIHNFISLHGHYIFYAVLTVWKF